MPKDIWDQLEPHSNAAKQAGQKGYRSSISQSLVAGLKRYVP
jgi:hypothetical protein